LLIADIDADAVEQTASTIRAEAAKCNSAGVYRG
jgi:hypothetical protein